MPLDSCRSRRTRPTTALALLWGLLTAVAPVGHAWLHQPAEPRLASADHTPRLAAGDSEAHFCLVCALAHCTAQAVEPPSLERPARSRAAQTQHSHRAPWRAVPTFSARGPPCC